jgi:transposase-like protein
MSATDNEIPGSPAWRARHGIRKLPQCPRCAATPPEIVMGENGPECADCGSQSMDLFLWPPEAQEPK